MRTQERRSLPPPSRAHRKTLLEWQAAPFSSHSAHQEAFITLESSTDPKEMYSRATEAYFLRVGLRVWQSASEVVEGIITKNHHLWVLILKPGSGLEDNGGSLSCFFMCIAAVISPQVDSGKTVPQLASSSPGLVLISCVLTEPHCQLWKELAHQPWPVCPVYFHLLM